MKTLKTYNEYTLNEKFLFNKGYDLLNKVSSELGANLYFISTFGTVIPVFFPFFQNLVNNSSFNMTITEKDIVLLTICAFSVVFNENKENINKLMTVIREKGLEEVLTLFIDTLKNLGHLFGKISSNFGKVISSIVDMFSYTALLVPLMTALNTVIQHYGITIQQFDSILTNPGGAVISTGIGMLTISLKHIINMIMRNFSRNTKSKTPPQQANEFVQKEEDIN